MDLLKSAVRLGAWLAVATAVLAQAPRVTETKLVGLGNEKQLLRKINGRWWSQDNREVYPPSNGGVFWELDSKPGVCTFFHHRPFDLARAESLHLWMTKPEVEAALGQPNRIFWTDAHAFWYYYAANGVKLHVRFVDDGVLGEATYFDIGEKRRPVESIQRELNGRQLYELMQERAAKRSQEWLAERTEENRIYQAGRSEALRRSSQAASARLRSRSAAPSMVTVAPVGVPRAADEPAPEKRIVPAAAFASVTPGATRKEVLERLGEPNSRFAIAGDDGLRESFTYDLDTGETVVLRLVDGKVTKVR